MPRNSDLFSREKRQHQNLQLSVAGERPAGTGLVRWLRWSGFPLFSRAIKGNTMTITSLGNATTGAITNIIANTGTGQPITFTQFSSTGGVAITNSQLVGQSQGINFYGSMTYIIN